MITILPKILHTEYPLPPNETFVISYFLHKAHKIQKRFCLKEVFSCPLSEIMQVFLSGRVAHQETRIVNKEVL